MNGNYYGDYSDESADAARFNVAFDFILDADAEDWQPGDHLKLAFSYDTGSVEGVKMYETCRLKATYTEGKMDSPANWAEWDCAYLDNQDAFINQTDVDLSVQVNPFQTGADSTADTTVGSEPEETDDDLGDESGQTETEGDPINVGESVEKSVPKPTAFTIDQASTATNRGFSVGLQRPFNPTDQRFSLLKLTNGMNINVSYMLYSQEAG